MARDAPRVVDDSDAESEVFSALLKCAPLPSLPPDAPRELERLTIDVDDPKRVYTIYRASRRHNFQILVERYIIQLRYGCQSTYCVTPTCFTCRRRVAGNAPLRRYNATSARTLACHLASNDNPERGLCPHLSGTLLKLGSPGSSGVSAKAKIPTECGGKRQSRIAISTATVKPDDSSTERVIHSSEATSPVSPARKRSFSSPNSRRSKLTNEVDISRIRATVDLGQGPAKKDHKSFVQNLFSTDALKMIEWLTPNNLEVLTTKLAEIHSLFSGVEVTKPEKRVPPRVAEEVESSENGHAIKTGPIPASSVNSTSSFAVSHSSATLNEQLPTADEDLEIGAENSTPRLNQNGTSSGNLSFTPNLVNKCKHLACLNSDDVKNGFATDKDSPLSRKTIEIAIGESDTRDHVSDESNTGAMGAASRIQISSELINSPCLFEGPRMIPNRIRKPDSSLTQRSPGDSGVTSSNAGRGLHAKANPSPNDLPEAISKKDGVHPGRVPQSLSTLSIEVVDALCRILREDRKPDLRTLTPISTDLDHALELYFRRYPKRIAIQLNAGSSEQWKTFIEQSIFYVLSDPSSLLSSFSDEKGAAPDFQILWSCMVRLTSAVPSLVFESLWVAAADLYNPPKELWDIYDRSKVRKMILSDDVDTRTAKEAACLMSICLHALIAWVPYLDEDDANFRASRFRSVGLTSLQPGRHVREWQSIFSLESDDIFTNELALRLVRRLFAAIPVRRQYQELSSLTDISASSRQIDILDVVLSPLNLFDKEPSPDVAFSPEERQALEKRTPLVLVEWARTILLQDWNGKAEVRSDGSFGGALATMAAIHSKRKSLFLGDMHFRTQYFADRLNSSEMPVEWLSFTADKKTSHLLDYPYLFKPSTLVTYFRAINYSRMNQAFETSNVLANRVLRSMAPGILLTDGKRRDDLINKLRIATSRFLVLQIRRDNVLFDAFNQLWRREERELSRPLKVKLGEDGGEEGSDSGGVQQEFFRLAIAEALNPDFGTFTIDERTKMTWFQPGSPEPLWKFELVGLIVSLAVYNGLTLPVTFPKSLYRKLLGAPVTELHHIEDGWPDLASGLTTLLDWDEKDGSVADIFSRTYEFSVELFGQHITCDMTDGKKRSWPQFKDVSIPNPTNAPLVDSSNRNEYVSDYIEWLIDISVRPQFEAFERGFLTCLSRRSLSLFTPELLQSVVEGIQEIDISELKHYARYVGWDASHRSVKDFWSIVKKFDSEEKKKLLEFVTASDRVPVGGMRNLQFVVQRNGVGDVDGHLPTSYTCYGTLLLPEYSSKEVLKQKLAMALENAKGFGFA